MNDERFDSESAAQRTEAGQAPQPESAAPQRANETPHPTERSPATVIVRGEAVAQGQTANASGSASGSKDRVPAKPLSASKVKLQGHLPALDDDRDVGVQKEQVVVRDGKADLAFTGTLLASAAPNSAPSGQWEEFRIYETSAEKFVFSKVTRHIHVEEQDECEAEIFEPEPSSKSSQLLRSARDLTRSHPLTWKDAAVDFFGYEPLAKSLYRKLGDGFEEHVR